MPRANWGIKPADVDDFDRDSQYTPYSGPLPPNGVYQFQVKALKFAAGTREKHPQLRVGLELVPRPDRKDERQYKGYFTMAFLPVMEKTAFRYVPFLDAIGVSGRDFAGRTITDEEGNIKKIGQWNNDGRELILAEIKDEVDQNGNSRKGIGWMGAVTEDDDSEYENDADEFDDDEEIGDDDEVPF